MIHVRISQRERQVMFYPTAATLPLHERGWHREYRHDGIDIIETEYSCRWTCLEMVAISRKRTNTDTLAGQGCVSLYQRSLISKERQGRGERQKKKGGMGRAKGVGWSTCNSTRTLLQRFCYFVIKRGG